ncbi:MAG: PAS domain-containing protein [Candidatus Latescibacteria bacterium]|nr:PAS domain-containing protein [Candidatus Latescibacterota bacterium]
MGTDAAPFANLLIENEGLLQTLFETMPVGLFLVDSQRQVTRVNRFLGQLLDRDLAEMLKVRPGNALGCIHVDDDPQGCGYGPACQECVLRRGVAGVIEGQDVRMYRSEHVMQLRLDDRETEKSFQISVSPLTTEGSDPLALVVIEDVTDMKIKDQELAEQRLAKERLKVLTETTGAVAHELNQPLQALVGFADLAALRSQANPEMCQVLEYIQESAERIADLVRRMEGVNKYVTKPYTGDSKIVDLLSPEVSARPPG